MAILMPEDTATNVPLEQPLVLLEDSSSADDAHWQIATANTFAAAEMRWDTNLRAPDGHIITNYGHEVWPADFSTPAVSGGTYYVRFMRRGGAWGTIISFTFETAKLTAADWRKGQ